MGETMIYYVEFGFVRNANYIRAAILDATCFSPRHIIQWEIQTQNLDNYFRMFWNEKTYKAWNIRFYRFHIL